MISRAPLCPPSAEPRLLVHLLEDRARDEPDDVFASIPMSDSPQGPYINITYLRTLLASDFLIHFLEDRFPVRWRRSEFETIAYVGANDIRYAFLLFAAIKSKVTLLFLSPRNPPEVNASLVDQTGTTGIIYADVMKPVVDDLLLLRPNLDAARIPDLQEMLVAYPQSVPYNVTIEEGLYDPILILHSSGSTGTPTPTTITNGTAATIGADYTFTAPEGRRKSDLSMWNFDGDGGKVMAPFPLFHMMGFVSHITHPMYSKGTIVWVPLQGPLTASIASQMLHHHNIRGAIIPPSIIEGMVHCEKTLARVRNLDWLSFAGGPLSEPVGDLIAPHTNLCSNYGSTETGALRSLMPRKSDWSWLEPNPDEHIRFEEVEEGLFEMIFLRDPLANQSYSGSAAIAYSRPHLEAYRSKDLFRRHPAKSNLWKFTGRRDDILVLSSGEKVNPVPMEATINSEPVIAGALVVGVGKSRTSLLIEPVQGIAQSPELVERIWETVKMANKSSPGQGRISRELIIISDPAKPFVRTGKGTVIRAATTRLYQGEIDARYRELEHPQTASRLKKEQACNDSHIRDPGTIENVNNVLSRTMRDLLHNRELSGNSNLYLMGLDSLKTAEAVSELKHSLGNRPWLTTELLYNNPTIDSLCDAVEALLNGKTDPANDDRPARITDLTAKYRLARSPRKHPTMAVSKITVSGTTGFMGRFLLLALSQTWGVKEIHCLNRAPNAKEQWLSFCRAWGLEEQVRADIVFHTTSFDDLDCFSSSETRFAIQSSQVVIHSAWRVDFNHSVNSFEDNLEGLQKLMGIMAETGNAGRLVYISSISSAFPLEHVEEGPVPLTSGGMSMGYGESKLVGERILHEAAMSHSLPVTILRVGQVAPPVGLSGVSWPQQETIPAIVKTSRSLGQIPRDLPEIAWLPVDKLCQMIIELSVLKAPLASYFNLVNPNPVAWNDLLEPMQEYCGADNKVVPLSDWIAALEKYDTFNKDELRDKPALKTLPYFKMLVENKDKWPVYETGYATLNSPTLADLPAIDANTLSNWLKFM